MIKDLAEYLCSLDERLARITTELGYARDRIDNSCGFVVVEPSRTAIAALQVNAASAVAALNRSKIPGADLDRRLQADPALAGSIKAATYGNALTLNSLRLYVWTRRQVVSDLLAGVLKCLETGLLVPSLALVRGALEQIADSCVVEGASRGLAGGKSAVTEQQSSVIEFSETLHQHLIATRIDWEYNSSTGVREGRKKSYKPQEGYVDLEASSVLNAVDALDRRLKGSRKTYEFLCEFAHPNAGPYLIARTEKRQVKRSSPLPFVETAVGTGTPNASLDWLSGQLVECYALLLDAALVFEELCTRLKGAEKAIESLTKKTVRISLRNYAPLWSPDEPCPCLSNLSVRNCCGRKIVVGH